jgi:phosphate transport system substrate-binding protein
VGLNLSRIIRFGMLVAFLGLIAAAPAAAQDSTPIPYTPPEEELSGSVTSDGSSTVGPLTQAVAEEFGAVASDVQVSVDTSGTGGGFERFCAGEIDVSNASRPIDDEERAICAGAGIDFYEFTVALDGLTVVVNAENDWVDCMTIDQLNQLWAPDSEVTTWADLNPEWPEEEIALYGPGTDSGTFDYFTDVVNGEEGASRTDYEPSEDDNVIVQGVAGDQYALGYFGLAYYLENQDSLKALQIDSGSGCVEPSEETVADGSYAPLSRPLFIYVSAASLERPEAQEFARFYLASAATLAGDVGYVGLPGDQSLEVQTKLEGAISGDVTPDSQSSGTPEASPPA